MELDYALRREWLETNGIGGYASSTLVGLNTRRYHGVLVAATHPPVGRMVLLSKLEETLVVGGRRHELSANRYPGVVHPRGYEYLVEFRRVPFPPSCTRWMARSWRSPFSWCRAKIRPSSATPFAERRAPRWNSVP